MLTLERANRMNGMGLLTWFIRDGAEVVYSPGEERSLEKCEKWLADHWYRQLGTIPPECFEYTK